jgi:hypothetical protein
VTGGGARALQGATPSEAVESPDSPSQRRTKIRRCFGDFNEGQGDISDAMLNIKEGDISGAF